MQAEEMKRQKNKLKKTKNLLRKMKIDVYIGVFFSNIIMYFIILTSGTILFKGGVRQINTVEQAAKALEPLAGKASTLLFALGIIDTGFLTIPILASCLSYMLSSVFNIRAGLDKKYSEAKFFYILITIALLLGLVITFIKINPIQILIYTAILYGLIAPWLILLILLIANNKKIMGKFTNGLWSNILGSMTFLLMFISSIALLYLYFQILINCLFKNTVLSEILLINT